MSRTRRKCSRKLCLISFVHSCMFLKGWSGATKLMPPRKFWSAVCQLDVTVMVASGTRKSYSLLQIFLHFEECNRLLYTWANPPHRIMSQCRVCPYDENKCEKWSVESYEVAYRHLSFSNHETCWCTKMVRIITVLTLQMTNRDKWDA